MPGIAINRVQSHRLKPTNGDSRLKRTDSTSSASSKEDKKQKKKKKKKDKKKKLKKEKSKLPNVEKKEVAAKKKKGPMTKEEWEKLERLKKISAVPNIDSKKQMYDANRKKEKEEFSWVLSGSPPPPHVRAAYKTFKKPQGFLS